MQIIPAIDLYNGECVRLHQGEFDRLTHYGSDPLLCAKSYVAQGATELHVVDLNGAEVGESQQLALALDISKQLSLSVQFGGGLRSQAVIEKVLASGIDRLVLGSLALTAVEKVSLMIRQYGVARFVLAFDVNQEGEQPLVAIKGWREKTQVSLWEILAHYQEFSGLRILCTDISRDGMLSGPNLDLYREGLQRFPQLQWQASGGVSCLEDLSALNTLGLSAVIVGKALYEKRFTLAEAIARC